MHVEEHQMRTAYGYLVNEYIQTILLNVLIKSIILTLSTRRDSDRHPLPNSLPRRRRLRMARDFLE